MREVDDTFRMLSLMTTRLTSVERAVDAPLTEAELFRVCTEDTSSTWPTTRPLTAALLLLLSRIGVADRVADAVLAELVELLLELSPRTREP